MEYRPRRVEPSVFMNQDLVKLAAFYGARAGLEFLVLLPQSSQVLLLQ